MTALQRTDLPTSHKAKLAASALAGQGRYGVVQSLAHSAGVSRPTVYQAGTLASEVLGDFFERQASGATSRWIEVDEAQLQRSIVALRVESPSSIRSIENTIPILYPGVKVSYGKIQEILCEAERRARAFNNSADLSSISAGALDEMFSQGRPVLAGVDLDSGYLFGLELRESRSADDWKAFLDQGKEQGMALDIVVKDAALGIQAGVELAYPGAEQRDDCFHAVYEIGKVHSQLERRAYGAITREDDAHKALERHRRTGHGKRRKLLSRLDWARRRCRQAIELFDRFEQAARRVDEALAFIDLDTGRIRAAEQMQRAIEAAADEMLAVGFENSRKVGRYIRNRAPGLASHMNALAEEFSGLAQEHGDEPVRLAGILARIERDLAKAKQWDRHRLERLRMGAARLLLDIAGPRAERVCEAVDAALERRHRASSAIEGFNAALRPHLYLHKGVTQGFLELFRAYTNLKTRRWGRHKGKSAHEAMTGERVADWLSVLGYPPAASRA